MDDRDFGKSIAQNWIEIIESERAKTREKDIYPEINNWLDQYSPTSVLDLGCGQGDAFSKLQLSGKNYCGIDPSPFLIERAQQLLPNSRGLFLLGNAYNLPFQNDSFDAAFSIAVWHLLEKIDLASIELNRVLKSNGHFLILSADPNQYEFWINQYKRNQLEGTKLIGESILTNGSIETDILHLHTFDDIKRNLEKTGLIISSYKQIRHWILIQGQKSA